MMNNENNFNGETITKSKKSKTKLIILAVAVLIVLLVGGGVYAVVNSNPKVKVLNALIQTSKELKDKQTLAEKIVGKDYLKKFRRKAGINQNMKFNLKNTTITELKKYNGAGISLDCSFDKKNKKIMFDMGGQYKGTNIANFKLYTDNKKVMIASTPNL